MTIPPDFRNNRRNYLYLASAYDITPIRQFKLLPNRPEPGLYRTLTDLAYQFAATKKGGGTPFFFNTGRPNGNKLLQALKKTLPPLESWEVQPAAPAPGPGPVFQPALPGPQAPGVTCKFNAALLQLLNLFFLKYSLDPTKPSGNIYTAINQNPAVAQYQAVHAVNNILVQFGETSAGLVTWLNAQVGSANVRAFNFAILTSYLKGLPSPPAIIAI
jgi:hypothetical protein